LLEFVSKVCGVKTDVKQSNQKVKSVPHIKITLVAFVVLGLHVILFAICVFLLVITQVYVR